MNNRAIIIAHRGASSCAPENTIAAFDKAVELKSDYIELDVQMSKDNKLVVIHDNAVKRTTNGTGYIKDLTFSELQMLDAGSWFNSSFAGEKISTLGEIFNKYKDKIGIIIEIKSPSLYPGIEENIASEIEKSGLQILNNEKLVIQSFDQNSLQKFHEFLPSIPIGILTSNKIDLTKEQLHSYCKYADFINPNFNINITKEMVTDIHALNMNICPWTVNNPNDIKSLLNIGVDGIITNYPDYVINY